MAVELGSAYINIVPSMKGVTGKIKSGLSGLDQVGSTAGKSLGSGVGKGLGSTTKGLGSSAGRAVGSEFEDAVGDSGERASSRLKSSFSFGAVAGAVGALTTSVVGSMGSLVSAAAEASDATDKFKSTLDFAGLDTKTIDAVTQRAQDYADKTVYNLGDIQNMTAQLASNGIKDYSGLAEAAGNLNAIAGGNAETFKSVGMVMTQTAGAGKLTTENWNQLSDAIPGASGKIQQALLDAGAYTGNFRDAMADGEITAEEFNDAVMKLGNEPVAVEAAQSTQTFEGMLGNLQATIEGQLANAFTQLKPIIGAAMDGIAKAAEVVLPKFVDGVKLAADGIQSFGKFLQENKSWVLPLTGALAGLAGSYMAVSKAFEIVDTVKAAGGLMTMFKNTQLVTNATRIWAGVTKAAAAAQKIFNASLLTNPITWVVAAIAAVVAALVLFFTKTETGRKAWKSFTEALGKGWDWVVEKFKAGIDWVNTNFGPTFESIKEKASGIWEGVTEKVSAAFGKIKEIISGALDFLKTGDTTDYAQALGMNRDSPIFTFLQGFRDKLIAVKDFAVQAFQVMKTNWETFTVGFGQFYQTWIAPVIGFFQTAVQMLGTVVSGAWDIIKIGFQALGQIISFVWTTFISPIFELFKMGAMLLGTVLTTVWNGAVVGFQFLGTIISTVWTTVIQPVWELIKLGAQIMGQVLQFVFQGIIVPAFQFIGTMIQSVWTNIIQPVWEFIKAAAGLLADILTGNFSNIGNRFRDMGQHISDIVHGVIQVAMDLFKAIVARVQAAWEAFKTAVSNIINIIGDKIQEMVGKISDIPGKIRNVFSNASQWLVDAGSNIINGLWNGLQNAWNNVASWLSDLPSKIRNSIGSISFDIGGFFGRHANGSYSQYVDGGIERLERYANGGGKENHTAQIARAGAWRIWAEPETGGEAYIPLAPAKRERSTAIAAKVADLFGYSLVDKATGTPYRGGYNGDLGPKDVTAFANGGITGDDMVKLAKGMSVNGQRASGPLEGWTYENYPSDPNAWGDCSYTQGKFSAFVAGVPISGRHYATGTQAQWLSSHEFLRGRGGAGDYRVGFKNGGPGGGHTAGTLPNGVNVEMGGGRGNGQYGGPAAGAWDSYFDTFFYKPVVKKEWNDPKVGKLGDLTKDKSTTAVELSDTISTATEVAAPAEAKKLSPYEAAATTFAKEMGNRSIGEIGFDAVLDFFGTDAPLTRKLLFTPMDKLLGVEDKSTAAVGSPTTHKAKASAEAINDAAVTSMTADELKKNPQLKDLKNPDVVKQDKVPSWGPEFFAREIARKAKSMGLDKLAAKIGLATALVESGNPLKMWANNAVPESLKYRHDAVGSDYDSVGLFQQRDNGAWGTVKERMTPFDSAGMFFNVLRKFDYKSMDPGAAAQKVQVSAFPDRYSQQMSAAESLLARTGVFDTGGILKKGHLALNLGGPERILDAKMTTIFDEFVGILPRFMSSFQPFMQSMNVVAEEIYTAFKGGDFGYAELSKYLGDDMAHSVVDEAAWMGVAKQEIEAAWRGEDFGLAATSRYLGGNDDLAAAALNGLETMGYQSEQVINFFVDEDDLVRAGDIQKMINDGMDGVRAELMGRRPKAAAMTRGGVM